MVTILITLLSAGIDTLHMIKTKVAVLEGRLFSSQLEKLKKNSKSSDWLEKSRPYKKTVLF